MSQTLEIVGPELIGVAKSIAIMWQPVMSMDMGNSTATSANAVTEAMVNFVSG